MSSDEDAAALMAAFRKKTARGIEPNTIPFQPINRDSRRASSSGVVSTDNESILRVPTPTVRRRLHSVRIPPANINRAEYTFYEPSDEVERIVRESSGKHGEMFYEVQITGNGVKKVSSTPYEGCSLIGKGGRTVHKATWRWHPTAFTVCPQPKSVNLLHALLPVVSY